MYANHFIKQGGGTWSWATDMGSSFVNSYSFYNLGSPFLWLSLFVPSRLMPFAMVPLFMLWMGFDSRVRVIVVILQATPIILLNTLTGFTTTEREKLELMRSLGATRWQTFLKVVFPNALPQVFTGLKIGCIFSTIAAMSADLAAGKEGLGYRIQQYSSLIMTEMAYGTIIIVALIGIVLFQIVVMIERRIVVWVK